MRSAKIEIDFSKKSGEMKPMHAVNNGPTAPYDCYELYGKLRDAGVPYARLHDTGGAFGGSRYVDIGNIFPDFDADENDPASYDFLFTDVLLSELIKNGIKPFYRLGTTIENYQSIRAYRIYPPKDCEKWARICEKIIRHYNEGWADGFHFAIEYWEIWNEPDNEPEIAQNPMWKGTKEQYFTLYEAAYRHLKKCFPNLKIGGYASCGFYALSDADFSTLAHSSPRTDYFIEFFIAFLTYIREHGVGLDFFSWHSYAGVKENVGYAAYARNTLDAYGYKNCEIFLNEWNPGIQNRGTQKDASAILSMMVALQNTSTDMCMYYDAQMTSDYCGLFDPVSHTVFRAYYAFYIFHQLYVLKNQNVCSVSGEALSAIAASSSEKRAVAIVNSSGDEVQAVICAANGKGWSRIVRVDETHLYETETAEDDGAPLHIPAYGIVYLEA